MTKIKIIGRAQYTKGTDDSHRCIDNCKLFEICVDRTVSICHISRLARRRFRYANNLYISNFTVLGIKKYD